MQISAKKMCKKCVLIREHSSGLCRDFTQASPFILPQGTLSMSNKLTLKKAQEPVYNQILPICAVLKREIWIIILKM